MLHSPIESAANSGSSHKLEIPESAGSSGPTAAAENPLLVGVVAALAVPRILSEERYVQKDKTRKKTGDYHESQPEIAVL